ncbi:MAG: hypothetical protein R3Y64_01555 [Peptostreptococcaceae bacterium]
MSRLERHNKNPRLNSIFRKIFVITMVLNLFLSVYIVDINAKKFLGYEYLSLKSITEFSYDYIKRSFGESVEILNSYFKSIN